MTKLTSIAACLLCISACQSKHSNSEYENIYKDRYACNGEMEITHKVVIKRAGETDTKNKPIEAVCNPSMYPSETEFEKENRKIRN